jgi:hypothetical protein
MKSNSVCTIVTRSHLGYALAMHRALQRFQGSDALMDVLVIGDPDAIDRSSEGSGLRLFTLEDIREPVKEQLYQKYGQEDMDLFRWSMKPVFMSHLLTAGRSKVLYLDPDIGIFNRLDMLFDALDESRVLLTPHWLCPDPFRSPSEFKLQFVGLFNAGFVGASHHAMDVLAWWARACLYRCSKVVENGMYADQSHLNLMPVHFEGVEIVRHRGCNLAHWNIMENTRTEVDGRVLINGRYEVIFIHFTPKTIRAILNGRDRHLLEFLDAWERFNREFYPGLDVRAKYGTPPPVRKLTTRERLAYGVSRRLRRLADVLESRLPGTNR